MKLPALVPMELSHFADMENEALLLEKLKQKPSELIRFFEYVAGDETWSAVEHPEFTKKALEFLTDLAHRDRLDLESIYFIAEQMQNHYENLVSLIPFDLEVEVEGGVERANSLLFQAGGEYFYSRYRAECVKQENPKIKLDTDLAKFQLINEYILRGNLPMLWRESPEFLFRFLVVARTFDLEELALYIEDVLKRYIDKGNVFDYLALSWKKEWPHLCTACMDYINNMESDIRLFSPKLDVFCFEFAIISEDALDIFNRVKGMVTQLMFRGRLPEDSRFPEIVTSCPKLNSVDISDTHSYTDNLLELPANLQELVIGNCLWLDQASIRRLLNHCSQLQKLNLRSNVQLNVNTWAMLRDFPKIIQLNLSRCAQIRDEDFKVILQAGENLVDLDLDDCRGISDHGFTEMARRSTGLVLLNLSNTNIGDGALAEIGVNSKRLISLNLSRCARVTPKGVADVVRGAAALRVLNITGCGFPVESIKELKKIRPFLTVVR